MHVSRQPDKQEQKINKNNNDVVCVTVTPISKKKTRISSSHPNKQPIASVAQFDAQITFHQAIASATIF